MAPDGNFVFFVDYLIFLVFFVLFVQGPYIPFKGNKGGDFKAVLRPF